MSIIYFFSSGTACWLSLVKYRTSYTTLINGYVKVETNNGIKELPPYFIIELSTELMFLLLLTCHTNKSFRSNMKIFTNASLMYYKIW